MTTVRLSTTEPVTGKPRNLNVNMSSVQFTHSVDLINTDGSLIIAGQNQAFNYNSFNSLVAPTTGTTGTTINIAKAALKTAIEEAFVIYYNSVF